MFWGFFHTANQNHPPKDDCSQISIVNLTIKLFIFDFAPFCVVTGILINVSSTKFN